LLPPRVPVRDDAATERGVGTIAELDAGDREVVVELTVASGQA
jgi:hypothetical protein